MQLEARVDIGITRPQQEVFEAIIDPEKMSRYFISKASARPEPGKTVTWTWADVGAEAPVRVLEVERDRRFAFIWGNSGQESRVTIEIDEDSPGVTAVTVTEGAWESDDAGIIRYGNQINGWTHFLMCLKASVEYGIDLRKDSVTRRHKVAIAAGPAAKH